MANTIAHLVFIPYIGIGHVISTVEVAKLFVNRDERLSVTILVIKLPGSGVDDYLANNAAIDRVSLVELPQPECPPPMSCFLLTYLDEYIKGHCNYVRKVVTELTSQPGSGPLAGFVVDMWCPCMKDVADEFNVPTNVFVTSGAAYLGFIWFMQTLNDDKNQDVVELSNSDTEVLVPSFVKPVPTKVFRGLAQTREGLKFTLAVARKLREVKSVIVNTFLELERHAIELLSDDSSIIPPVYPVGPLLNLEGSSGKPLDDDVFRWLDAQPSSSVVLLCFGSLGSFDDVQVKEIACALERSGHRFVWSLRRPPSNQTSNVTPEEYEDPGAVLPEGFLERTTGVGKVIGWAPQVALLAHNAVGGFVSHCGWNSLLESLWFGVPVATWPMYSEQQMNAFEMVVELGLAVEIKMDYIKDIFVPNMVPIIVSAEEIERGIRRVMEDQEIRRKAKEMSEKSWAAVAEGGSSYATVGNIIQDFISNVS